VSTSPVHTEEFNFVHTGPGTLAGRYLRRFWQPIYLSRDVAKGKAVPIRIMSEEFTGK
jgi:5,5'-dehydrodivanillate O-demethylase oxygenase subunit